LVSALGAEMRYSVSSCLWALSLLSPYAGVAAQLTDIPTPSNYLSRSGVQGMEKWEGGMAIRRADSEKQPSCWGIMSTSMEARSPN
jgi:hypothetical protein